MIPKAVYELLPYIYLSIALALILLIDDPVRFLPAAIFGICGLMVFIWRRQNRRELAEVENEWSN